MGGNLDMCQPTMSWLCAGASVTGRSHERAGVDCQDAWALFRATQDKSEVLAACICDGAGSAAKSRDGARLTSWIVSYWLAKRFEHALDDPDAAAVELVQEAKESLECTAGRSGTSISDYACTIVAVAVRGDGHWLAVHLGDGGIIGQFDQTLLQVSAPQKGEFANVTYFITDEDASENIELRSSTRGTFPENPQGFALFSDGLEGSLVSRHTGEAASAVATMLAWHHRVCEDEVSQAIEANLNDVFRTQTGDDCTLVLIGRRPDTIEEEEEKKD